MSKSKPLTECELENRFEDMIDETTPLVVILGMPYNPSQVLKNVDPTAYRCCYADWLDAEVQNESLTEIDGEYYE
jgi:hypothetical protein